jgi:hypothetical protein
VMLCGSTNYFAIYRNYPPWMSTHPQYGQLFMPPKNVFINMIRKK